MRLDHLDLHVPDVSETRDFFVKYFGLAPVETRGANGLAVLQDDAGFELVISRPIEKLGGADTPTAGSNTYHIGFTLGSREAVSRLFAELSSDGLAGMEPKEMRGMWLFYCFAPGRILVEVRAS